MRDAEMSTTPPASAQAAPPVINAPKPERPGAGRMPSLNQLAARINITAPSVSPGSTGSQPASNRPRLAASLLRTGSTNSVSTAASTTDSMAVQAPSTRSTSPAGLPTPPQSTTPTIPEDSIPADPLTSETLKELNQQEAAKKTKVGYKGVPGLDAIAARIKARSLSVDGSVKPPDAEMIEDPQTPGLSIKAPEHPLQFPWTLYHDSKAKMPFTPAPGANLGATHEGPSGPYSGVTDSGDYEAGLTVVGEFDTVESFCRYFNWLKPPSQLERNSNYHLFKSGIKPMWEDPANANGGKWVLTMKGNPQLLDRCWAWVAMALVGEELEEADEVCGAVVSLRSKVDRIQVWTRGKDDVEKLNGIGKKLIKLLDVSEADGVGLEFQYNSDDRPLPNKFISIQAMPASSFRTTFSAGGHARTGSSGYAASPASGPGEGPPPVSAGAAGNSAFGGFGMGGIGAWRGGKRPN